MSSTFQDDFAMAAAASPKLSKPCFYIYFFENRTLFGQQLLSLSGSWVTHCSAVGSTVLAGSTCEKMLLKATTLLPLSRCACFVERCSTKTCNRVPAKKSYQKIFRSLGECHGDGIRRHLHRRAPESLEPE